MTIREAFLVGIRVSCN